MRRAQRSARSSKEDVANISLVESIRRATHQRTRSTQARKPYSKPGEEAGASRIRRTQNHLHTHGPQRCAPIASAQIGPCFHVAEAVRECQATRGHSPGNPSEPYPRRRNITSHHEWAETPQYDASSITTGDSPALLDLPSWRHEHPLMALDELTLQKGDYVGEELRYPNFSWDSEASKWILSGPLTDEEVANILNDPMHLSPPAETDILVYGNTTSTDLNYLADVLKQWEVVDESRPSAF